LRGKQKKNAPLLDLIYEGDSKMGQQIDRRRGSAESEKKKKVNSHRGSLLSHKSEAAAHGQYGSEDGGHITLLEKRKSECSDRDSTPKESLKNVYLVKGSLSNEVQTDILEHRADYK